MFNFKQYKWKQYNISLIILVILLSIIGVIMVSFVEPSSKTQKHIMGLVMGIIIMAITSMIDYHFICNCYILLYIINIILLSAVKIFGQAEYNAQRWLQIGGFSLQPSELTKIIMIIFMAQIFTILKDKMDRFSSVVISGILMAVPIIFVIIQPNLSTGILLALIYVVIIFAAGLHYKIILPILAVGIPLAGIAFWYVQQPNPMFIQSYQQKRILALLNPQDYPDLSYQQDNSSQVIGSGKLYGKALTEEDTDTRLSKNVPVAESDFIFAVIGEEFGFIGGCAILGLLFIVVIKCIIIAKSARDHIGMLIAIGISAMFAFQIFINVGVATFILPNTGQPLPFVSYGLSSLFGSMIGIGLILNIGLQRKNYRG